MVRSYRNTDQRGGKRSKIGCDLAVPHRLSDPIVRVIRRMISYGTPDRGVVRMGMRQFIMIVVLVHKPVTYIDRRGGDCNREGSEQPDERRACVCGHCRLM